MRTTIDIDEELLREAQRVTGIKKKRELVHEALREIVRKRKLRQLKGSLGRFDLDLDLKKLRELRKLG
jgi:Arc/MetJ family transcription regulator